MYLYANHCANERNIPRGPSLRIFRETKVMVFVCSIFFLSMEYGRPLEEMVRVAASVDSSWREMSGS